MKTGLTTFRSRIILVLIIVVTSISFIAFYFHNYSITRIINREYDKNMISVLSLLKNEFYNTLGTNEGKIIYTLLDSTLKNKNVKAAYLLNSKDELIYPAGIGSQLKDTLHLESISFSDNHIVLKTLKSEKTQFKRAFIQMENKPACYSCHSPSIHHIGTVVIDISMENTKRSIVFSRNFSFLFSIIMLFFIGGVIMFIHYKFVKKALGEFFFTINAVNKGDLYKRLTIPETKELGELGKSFNIMLDNFQNSQKELQLFHKKELQHNYKLATIGEMAARLAHEIRNPITGIANAIEIINSENSDDKNKMVLNEVHRQANRVNNAITDLLKFSRQKDMNLQASEINGLIKSLVFFLENQSPEKEIVFNLELQEDIPVFQFDYARMEDVLMNLGLNAIQSIHKKGTVTFRTSYVFPENMIKISVSDSGKGIPEKIKSQIFNPFFTSRNEGTGLGLAIVKDIIDSHHGKIWVENNKGEGCTFFILLPVEKV